MRDKHSAVLDLAWGLGGGWRNLMNMSNWTPVGKVDWKTINGELWSTNGNGFLLSKQSYGDFEIRADFWVSPDANLAAVVRNAASTRDPRLGESLRRNERPPTPHPVPISSR